MEVMPLVGKVDAVLTDPPYGIGVSSRMSKQSGTQYGKAAAKKSEYDYKEWDNKTPDLSFLPNVPSIIWGGNYFELHASPCWLVWDKQNGANDFADCELAWTNLDKAVRRIYWRWNGMIRKGDDVRAHPTQKPVGVMQWCINHLPTDTQTILDPFMGSGTTLVACAKMGRKGIGIELDEDYFEIACKRVEDAYRQPDLFIEKEKPLVTDQETLTL